MASLSHDNVDSQLELLKASAKELRPKLNIQDRKYRLKKYRKCFIGEEAIPKIIDCGFASTVVMFLSIPKSLNSIDINLYFHTTARGYPLWE